MTVHPCTLRALCGALALLMPIHPTAVAQDMMGVPDAPTLRDTYRLRIENMEYGRIEASVDGGLHWLLLGRVTHPATRLHDTKTTRNAGSVIGGGSRGLVLAPLAGKTLTLLPAPTGLSSQNPGGKQKTAASSLRGMRVRVRRSSAGAARAAASSPDATGIVTTLPGDSPLFRDLRPPIGSPLRLAFDERAENRFPVGYSPSESDRLLVLVTLPLPAEAGPADAHVQPAQSPDNAPNSGANPRDAVRHTLETLARIYFDGTWARARQYQRPLVTGNVTLNARLPEGEPDPIAMVTYSVDGEVIEARNVAPFRSEWDSRRVADGEHLIEIRALNRSNVMITRARTLLVVRNHAPAG